MSTSPRMRRRSARAPHRPRRRLPRSLWVLVVALIAFAAVLWLDRRDRADALPPPVSDRHRLVAEALAALRADPSVADVVYASPQDQWEVTPIAGTADATSFARYVCFVLEAQHVTRTTTSVRVIDAQALEASGFDYTAASRGRLTCETETR